MSEHSAENDAWRMLIETACDKGSCAAQRGHEGTCAEASGFILTCEDLGCVDGKTIQGRKYPLRRLD